ncbi:MAG: CBS domain-containing protein [Chitinophagaceae bacterium]
MLTRDLISHSIPHLQMQDTAFHALQLMSDNHITHLPVVEDEKYVGIISEEQLLQGEDSETINEFLIPNSELAVQASDHFLKAIQLAVISKLSIVPVIEEELLLGVVTYDDLLRNASEFMSLSQPGALIVLELDDKNYSLAEISRIVESNDAQITQLNTYTDSDTGIMQITIRVSKLEVSDIVSTFQRYEYNIKYYFGEELYENEVKTNYDNLMNYLKI